MVVVVAELVFIMHMFRHRSKLGDSQMASDMSKNNSAQSLTNILHYIPYYPSVNPH